MSHGEIEDWALEEARKIFGTEIDNTDLDLMALGYDADSAVKIFAALNWLSNPRLTAKQICEIGNRYFPHEEWDTANEDKARLAIAQRCLPHSQTAMDNLDQYLIYTGIGLDDLGK